MNSLWDTITTPLRFLRSEASEETIMETVTTPLRFFRSEASEETIMETVTTPLRFFRSEAPEETIMETVNTPLRFSTSEVPEETTIRESEEPEESVTPRLLPSYLPFTAEELSDFSGTMDKIRASVKPISRKEQRRRLKPGANLTKEEVEEMDTYISVLARIDDFREAYTAAIVSSKCPDAALVDVADLPSTPQTCAKTTILTSVDIEVSGQENIAHLPPLTKDIAELPPTTALELWYLENPDRVDALNTFVSNNFEETLLYYTKCYEEAGSLSSKEVMSLYHFIEERDEHLLTAFQSFTVFKNLKQFLHTILALARYGIRIKERPVVKIPAVNLSMAEIIAQYCIDMGVKQTNYLNIN